MMYDSFRCALCDRDVRCLAGSVVVVLRGLRQRACRECGPELAQLRQRAVERKRVAGRIVNSLRERERHEREAAS